MSNGKAYTIGIDIGGTNIEAGIVDQEGSIIKRVRTSMAQHETLKDLLKEVKALLEPFPENMIGVGIGAPDVNCYKGTIEHAVNLKWNGIVPLAEIAREVFQMQVRTMNDANAAALGEMYFGSGQHHNDFILLTLGTGVGSGVISNRRLVLGQQGMASKLGHVVVIPNGAYHPGSGLYGTLEAYCSSFGIVNRAKTLLEEYPNSVLQQHQSLTPALIAEAAANGDEVSIKTFKQTGEILGKAIANFVHFSAPEAVVLFGGITLAGDLLLEPTRKAMEENLLKVFHNKVQLKISSLNGADAAILGAASLFKYEL